VPEIVTKSIVNRILQTKGGSLIVRSQKGKKGNTDNRSNTPLARRRCVTNALETTYPALVT